MNFIFMNPFHRVLTALVFLAVVTASSALRAEIFHSKESALRLAFPDADNVDKQQVFLNKEAAEEIEQRARVRLASRLVTMYVGHKGEAIVGYAFIETHTVRSLPETILVVIDPAGRASGVHILAFHEPPEYAPSARWLEQFRGRPLEDDLSLRGDIAAITGATITANSITAAVRRTLAIFEVAVGAGDFIDEPSPQATGRKAESTGP